MWVDNCIGLNNLRYFLGLLFYLSVLIPMLTLPYFIVEEVNEPVSPKIARISHIQQLIVFMGYLLNTTLILFIIPYTIWNFCLAMNGITQVEHTK